MFKTKFAPVIILLFLLTTYFRLFADTQKATLSYFKGTISIYRKETLVYPETNMRIYADDSLVTGDDSVLEITYEDGSVSSLVPNSALKIRQLKKEKGLFTTRIKALMGSVLCKIKKLRKGETFQVYTPTAVAAVRGTVFEVVVHENQETSFNVLSGQLYAKALIEGAQTYLLKDEFRYFVGKEGITDVRKLTEEEVANLKSRAKVYIQNFIEEKKGEIEEGIKKEMKKGCLGFI